MAITQNKALLRSAFDHLIEASSDLTQLSTGLTEAGIESDQMQIRQVEAAVKMLDNLFENLRSEFPTHRVPEGTSFVEPAPLTPAVSV